jgi:hypothetical protein
MQGKRKVHKYHSKKVEINGMVFDSKKEAKRFSELSLMEKAGTITDLQTQVKFVLIPAQYKLIERYGKKGQRLKDGMKCLERECAYIADFVYFQHGVKVVEDTKGFRTKDFIIKRKLMLYMHGIEIKEI